MNGTAKFTASAAPEAAESWSQAELGRVDLGDARLNRRLVTTAAQLAAQPSASINQACQSWFDTKAAYNLFANPRVSGDKILAPHQARTAHRLQGQPLILAVQDTTLLDYTAHPKTSGLGPLGSDQQTLRGLLLHSTLALTPAGLPLGLLDHHLWARPPLAERLPKAQRQRQPIEEQESGKWLHALRAALARTPAGTKLVTVCDREGDIYELFAEALALDTGLLVRAHYDRLLHDPAGQRLWAVVAAQPLSGLLPVALPARGSQAARTATVSVRYATVTLQPPTWRTRQVGQPPLAPLTLSAILVLEEEPPAAVAPLQWKLLTTVPATSFSEATERIEWYTQRWQVEMYHKVLKSGCRVEACRLATAERLSRYLSLMSIIAWRLCWLTYSSRHQPQAPCTTLLAEHEWRALYATFQRTTRPPTQPPSVRQAVRWVAQLGGFLARTRDGEPGLTVLWRGWHRLHDISQTWLLLHPP